VHHQLVFLRLKLGEYLSQHGLAPHIYEIREEALEWINRRADNRSPPPG